MLTPIRKQLSADNRDVFDLFYIDNIFYHFLLSSIRYSKSVFRVMDIHSEFYGWTSNVLKVAQRVANRTDMTIYSAKGLEGYVRSLAPSKTCLIPNGVDFNFFHDTIEYKIDEKHPVLKNIQNPIILYVGIIDTRVDFHLIKKVAKRNPELSFVFAGPLAERVRLNDIPTNIHILGPVPHKEIPVLMSSAKAGIIPFDTKRQMDRIKGIRPLKLFEYFAAAIPVISARWDEIELMDSPVWIYDNEEQFTALVKKAVNEPYNPNVFREFAKHHDWKNKFDSLIESLDIYH